MAIDEIELSVHQVPAGGDPGRRVPVPAVGRLSSVTPIAESRGSGLATAATGPSQSHLVGILRL
ncbi:MAG: hypothetical protein ABIX28_02060 [Vicinamibacterales bacterium]